WRRIAKRVLEPDPADRLLDLRLLQPGDRHAVDHRERNLLDLDVEGAQVIAIELSVGAHMLLESDAAVSQDFLDPAAALAVGPGVNDHFHLALYLRCAPERYRGNNQGRWFLSISFLDAFDRRC